MFPSLDQEIAGESDGRSPPRHWHIAIRPFKTNLAPVRAKQCHWCCCGQHASKLLHAYCVSTYSPAQNRTPYCSWFGRLVKFISKQTSLVSGTTCNDHTYIQISPRGLTTLAGGPLPHHSTSDSERYSGFGVFLAVMLVNHTSLNHVSKFQSAKSKTGVLSRFERVVRVGRIPLWKRPQTPRYAVQPHFSSRGLHRNPEARRIRNVGKVGWTPR